MKSDLNNLTTFDICVVAAIAVGIALVGLEIFLTLPEGGRANIVLAVEIFDVGEYMPEVYGDIKLVLDITNEVYDEFYLAFVQTDFIPTTVIAKASVAYETVGLYADNITRGYYEQPLIAYHQSEVTGGQVLGAAIVRTLETVSVPLTYLDLEPNPNPCGTQQKKLELLIPYSYENKFSHWNFQLNEIKTYFN